MKNPLRDIPTYLQMFQRHLGRRIYLVFALTLVAALAEGVGIVMLLPLLQGLGTGGDIPTEGVPGVVNSALSALGVGESTVGLLLIIAAAFILKGLLTFGAQGFNAYLRGALLQVLKGRLFSRYSQMSYSYYSSHSTGHFINVINEQINRALKSFNSFMQFGTQTVNGTIYLALAFLVAWRFGLAALVLGIVLLTLFRGLSNYVRVLSRETATESGYLSKLLIQTLQAFKYLTATAQTVRLEKGILDSIKCLTSLEVRTNLAGAFTNAVREPIVVVSITLIMLAQLIWFEQPLAPILVSILLFYRGLNTVLSLQRGWQNTLESIGSIELVDDEFRQQTRNAETGGDTPLAEFNQGIKLKDLKFSYSSDLGDVLRGVSLTIPAKTSVAFVGESGAGKSTLVDILTLMLKPQEGQILIDGIPGDEIELQSWRRQIGYVSQDTVVFDDSIANNICLWQGNPAEDSPLMERIRQAANAAYLDDFIETLPQGYHSMVGDRGLRLSGGQRQRLSIARELFRKPSLLILDEATSALDSESERAIQKSIDDLKGIMTVILIAHRLSTIRNVDQVYVFDKGQLIEHGSYESLRDRDGSKFADLIALQVL
jgi:ABC-type multidrug transport system fused ATPase/permease subunit